MKIDIVSAPHCKLRDRLPALAEDLRKQGHDVAIVAQSGQAIRTVPSIIVDGVVLDVETLADLDVARIVSTKPPAPVAPKPDQRDVLIAELVAKVEKLTTDVTALKAGK